MATEISGLENHVGYWLRFVSNHVSESFRARLKKHDVTVSEWVALRTLYNHPSCALNVLAKEMGIDAGVTSRLVERLIRKKWVTRKISSEDRRFVTLELTSGGRTLVPRLAKEADQNDEFFFRHLSKVDRERLIAIMKVLIKSNELKEKPTR